jgi:hypothetical protein
MDIGFPGSSAPPGSSIPGLAGNSNRVVDRRSSAFIGVQSLMQFTVTATDGAARSGKLTLPHGVVDTPNPGLMATRIESLIGVHRRSSASNH